MSLIIPVLFLSLCLIWLNKTRKTGAIVGIAFSVIVINVLSITTWNLGEYKTIYGPVFSATLTISDLVFWITSLYILSKQRKNNRLAGRHMFIISIPFIFMLLFLWFLAANSGIQR